MAGIPRIMRTFGAYFQEKRRAQYEAKKRKQEKKALERQLRKAQESLSPNSITSTSKATNKNKKKKKQKLEKIYKDKSPIRTCSSVHMIFTPMGNKR